MYRELQAQIETLHEELKKAHYEKQQADKAKEIAWQNKEYLRETLHKFISSDLLSLDLKSLCSDAENVKQKILSIKDKIIRIGMENLTEQKDTILSCCKSLSRTLQTVEEIRKEIETIVIAASKPQGQTSE